MMLSSSKLSAPNLIFEGLKDSKDSAQTCLVAVNEGSVAVYPFEKRLADIRRRAWRSGFKIGLFTATRLVSLVIVLAWYFYGDSSPVVMPRMASSGAVLATNPAPPITDSSAPAVSALNRPSDPQDEAGAIAQWHATLASLPDEERLLFVGTYDRYEQVLPLLAAFKSEERIIVIRSNKLRSGKYLVLVHLGVSQQDFEAARARASRQLGDGLLKWNRAQRYKQLL